MANKANEAGQGAYDAQVRNDEQDVTLADHESRIEAAEATLINHEHRIAAAESTLADHETRITAAETELADHETRIAANESELANHDARITQNTTDIDALDTRLTAAEGSISTLQSTVGDHSTRISALEYATTRKKSEVVYSGVSVTIPTSPTNLVSLLKTLTPSSGELAPFFDTVNNKMVVFNENKTLFFKLSIVGTWPSGTANRSVQLSDGRTVTVGGKLHGAGANAFYEGIDNEGNMVRVPASSIAAPATSSASAQNYAMKKDIDAIANADASALDFMTGMTGGAGNPAIGADVRSRLTGKEQRQLYNSAQRIQGRMQNQGVAAARDMGASGINTVAEAKMYFQGMPQVDYSSPEAMQQSIREIQEYTNNYNQQYNVDVGKSQRQKSQPAQVSQPAASSNFSSLWGD